MDSAKRCRDQAAECLRLMKLAQSETEARVLRDIGQSWVRIANQIERYSGFANRAGLALAHERAYLESIPNQETCAPHRGNAPRRVSCAGDSHPAR